MVVLTKLNYLSYGKYENATIQPGNTCVLYPSGDYYEGNVIRGGAKNGQGILYYAEGGNYNGQFLENKRVGKGRMCFPDESQYIGQFMNDDADGNGIFTDSKGNRYMSVVSHTSNQETGHFIKGRLYGKGEIRYENSNLYIGNFKGTKRDGYGVMNYNVPTEAEPKTGTYEGHYKSDKRDGQGIMTYDNMSVFKGLWSRDSKLYGEFTDSNNTKYIGSFYNNQFNGAGRLYRYNGQIIEGDFINGEF